MAPSHASLAPESPDAKPPCVRLRHDDEYELRFDNLLVHSHRPRKRWITLEKRINHRIDPGTTKLLCEVDHVWRCSALSWLYEMKTRTGPVLSHVLWPGMSL
jgi:hypothetical protein